VALIGGTANSAIRFSANAFNAAGESVHVDNLSINFANPNTAVTGTANGEILVGNDTGTGLNGLGGNDRIFAGGGDDVITQAAAAGGRDFIDGGANGALGDRVVINGTDDVESFIVYAASDALTAGITGLNANTEIVITRNGVVISELDNVEEITINTAGGADTVTAVGNFNPTSLFFNTITATGDGSDQIDASGLTSAHRLVFAGTTGEGSSSTMIDSLTSVLVESPAPSSSPVLPDLSPAAPVQPAWHANTVFHHVVTGHLSFAWNGHDQLFKHLFDDAGSISM
jgi:hypothetical protein